MSAYLPRTVEKVIEEFERLPGIGQKSAARMAYHYIRSKKGDATNLANALIKMEESIVYCQKCFNVSEKEECDICSSLLRDSSKLCLVEEPLDVVAFESSAIFDGFYFVIGGVISPADGVGPEELRLDKLPARIGELLASSKSDELELIIATNPSLEGEVTANYITDIVKNCSYRDKCKVTRLAMGLPTGADLEYADRLTLKRSLEGRRSAL